MWDNAKKQNCQNTMSDRVIKYNKNMLQFQINVTAGVTVWRVWSGRLAGNRKRISIFDMPNHYIVCLDSGSVRTAQMNNVV